MGPPLRAGACVGQGRGVGLELERMAAPAGVQGAGLWAKRRFEAGR